MLEVEGRFVIKDMHARGVSVSEIARVTGRDRKTVRAVLNGPVTPPPQRRTGRGSKLDPYVPYLEKRIEEGVLNCAKLFAELRRRGYAGGKSLVKEFVQPYREARRQEATVRYETEPGEQAQVDWGHFGFIEQQGRRRRLYAFLMTLGWSRALYVEFTVSTNALCWVRCHVHAFRYFGGVPRVVLHDNLKTAVLEREADGKIHWNPRYLDVAAYYGFGLRACQPYRAQTKGKVESGIRYLRGNFWPGLTFVDLPDLNQQVLDWLDTTANVRIHGTTGEAPSVRLPLEGLRPIEAQPEYDTSLISFRRSSKDCLLSYHGNHYSVPCSYARELLQVNETEASLIRILNREGEEIAHHRLAAGRHERVVLPSHYEGVRSYSRPARRATAIQLVAPQRIPACPDAPDVEARPLVWYDQVAEVGRE